MFASGSGFSRISELLASNKVAFSDVSVLTNFVDNHDNPRFLNKQNDVAQFKNALAFVLLAEGIPIVYYGSEQGFSGGADPANREVLWTTGFDTSSDLYQFIANVNKNVRVKSGKNITMDVAVNDNTYAFIHGSALVVLNNYGSGASNFVTISAGGLFSDGDTVIDVISNITATVSGGNINFNINNGLPAIFQRA